jgi:hypothetical protein
MYTRVSGTLQGLALPTLLGSVFVLAGCAPAQVAPGEVTPGQICPPDCVLTITLPEDVETPPGVSPSGFKIRQGEQINFDVRGRPRGKATILRFEVPAFEDRNKRLVYTINTRAWGRRYTARTDLDCSRPGDEPPDHCRFKYEVINHGNELRPTLDPWIIIHQ